jgi:hypothetical protein
MSKTVTLRLHDKLYRMFLALAKKDNRSLSNFIETAALRFIENSGFVDDFEMKEIQSNRSLNLSIKRGLQDAKMKRGHFA